MPTVTATPKGMLSGEVVTEFTDTTSTTAVTYTYPVQQAGISIENSGVADIFVTVGSYTNQTIQPDKKWSADVLYTSFTIRSTVNSQEFTATAYQYDVDGSGAATPRNGAVIKTNPLGFVEFSSGINTSWDKWPLSRYIRGMVPARTPLFNKVIGTLETDSMFSVRGGKGRWNSTDKDVTNSIFVNGGHVFEAWSTDETYRLTMLVGKRHNYADIQLFNESTETFGWIKIGSDNDTEGFDFTYNQAIFKGTVTFQKQATLNLGLAIGTGGVIQTSKSSSLEINGGNTVGATRTGGSLRLFGEDSTNSPGSAELFFGSYQKDLNSTFDIKYMPVTGASNVKTVLSVNKNGMTLAGGLNLASIPTTNPNIVGQVWNNAGVLTVSAG